MHQSRQIKQAVRVPPLIIIPRHDLEELGIKFCTSWRIDDGTVRATVVVAAHEFLIRHAKNPGHARFGRAAERREDFG